MKLSSVKCIHAALAVGCAFAALPATSAQLFVAATNDKVIRYRVEPGGPATWEAEMSVPTVVGLAFSAQGDLFAASSPDGRGAVARFRHPGGNVEGSMFHEGNLGGPHWLAVAGEELLIAQRDARNLVSYTVSPNGTLSFRRVAASGIDWARGVALSPWGELFVTECCTGNRIRRFRSTNGQWQASGSIEASGANGLSSPHGMAFSSRGELFVASPGNHSVVRFRFNAALEAEPSGSIRGGSLSSPLGLAFSPWGELFVANANRSVLSRFTFDSPEPGANARPGTDVQLPAGARDVAFLPSAGAAVVLGYTTGLLGPAVICENQTTGQTVTISGSAPPWDCRAEGLITRPGDRVQVRLSGTAQ